jgi:hypothetical protein
MTFLITHHQGQIVGPAPVKEEFPMEQWSEKMLWRAK